MSVLPIESILEGDTLDVHAAENAMAEILEAGASAVETSAFLTALAARARRGGVETEQELVGFARALQSRMAVVRAPREAMDTCGTGGSGRPKLNVGTLVALTLAALGHPVAKHGNRSSVAIGSSDVLELAGVPIAPDAALAVPRAEALLASTGLAFLHAPHHHPALAGVAPIRRALGFRTVFNLMGPLCNPARVARQLVGVSDPARVEPMARALATLGCERAIVFGGAIDELTLEDATPAIEIVSGRRVGVLTLHAREHGVRDDVDGRVGVGLEGFVDVLDARCPRSIELVAWNAGVALAIARGATSILDAIAPSVSEAREAITSGRVRALFDRHRAAAIALSRGAASEAA